MASDIFRLAEAADLLGQANFDGDFVTYELENLRASYPEQVRALSLLSRCESMPKPAALLWHSLRLRRDCALVDLSTRSGGMPRLSGV